ncbi:MAG: hypothetical protein PVG90_10535, partial [Bacillota bacterium]
MKKSHLTRLTVIGLLFGVIITLTGIYIATAQAEKSGVYSQNGGTVTDTGKTYTATDPDQSGVFITNSGIYNLTDSSVTKTGATSSIKESVFNGLNAGILAEGGSTISVADCAVTTDANGASGVFTSGAGSTVNLSKVNIKTSAAASCG